MDIPYNWDFIQDNIQPEKHCGTPQEIRGSGVLVNTQKSK